MRKNRIILCSLVVIFSLMMLTTLWMILVSLGSAPQESIITNDFKRWRVKYWIQDISKKMKTVSKSGALIQKLDDDQDLQYALEILSTKIDLAIHDYEVELCLRNDETEKKQFYGHISKSGGWCAVTDDGMDYSKKVSRWQTPPKQYLDILAEGLFKNKRVADLGAGVGKHTIQFRKRGVDCFGFDGSIGVERATDGVVKYFNLGSRHVSGGINQKFDWVYALDVAEHVPRKYEDIVIGNIAMLATEGILINWADKNRGGYGHYNPRDRTYVLKKFQERGFYVDEECEKIEESVKFYLRHAICMKKSK